MLNVILAGYNVDADILEKLKTGGWAGKENISPESISAAYARISRDPRPVTELRKIAREEVDKARKSNATIVFKMGHHSVAEHAMLNFDILGLSRVAAETLEESRLCSFTEKSQRYITLDGDFHIPTEYNDDERDIYIKVINQQIELYKDLFSRLHEYQKKQNPELLEKKYGSNIIEGWAKEDARYALAMATECQLGFTCNARNLEHIIRKCRRSPLEEVRQLGQMLFDDAKKVVPSLIILSDPEQFKKQFGFEVADGILKHGTELLAETAESVFADFSGTDLKSDSDVTLLDNTNDPDTAVITALLHCSSRKPYHYCLQISKQMQKQEKQKEYIKTILKDLSEHDSLYRGFEMVNFQFELIISSSAYAQLKRHRMMTLLKQDYDPDLGYTIPPAIKEIGQEHAFREMMQISEDCYQKISRNNKQAAEYILTNAHKRRVLVNVNLRELYHLARLRMDSHAQWDIRNLAEIMIAKVRAKAPVTAALACGKDTFKETFKAF